MALEIESVGGEAVMRLRGLNNLDKYGKENLLRKILFVRNKFREYTVPLIEGDLRNL
jgi:hypothetical protein